MPPGSGPRRPQRMESSGPDPHLPPPVSAARASPPACGRSRRPEPPMLRGRPLPGASGRGGRCGLIPGQEHFHCPSASQPRFPAPSRPAERFPPGRAGSARRGQGQPRSPLSSAGSGTAALAGGGQGGRGGSPAPPAERTHPRCRARGGGRRRGLSGRGPRLRQRCVNTAAVPAAI